MYKVLITLAVLLVATAASAQIDSEPNMIGVYFDSEATVYCSGASGTQVGYVMLTNVTYDAVYAWEAAFLVELVDFNGYVNHVRVPSDLLGFQIGVAPNVIMSYAEPIPVASTVIVVGEFDFGYFGTGTACIRLGANDANPSIPGHVAVQVGATAEYIVEFGRSLPDGDCAGLGPDDCSACNIVADGSMTFGGLKALYR